MVTQTNRLGPDAQAVETSSELQYERWHAWPVSWTAVWVGALTSITIALLFGLIGIAVGAHLLGPEHRVVDLHKMHMWGLIFSVCGAFFAFVAGGWVTGKIAGILHSEPAMLHGAIAWLIAVPLMLAFVSQGAGPYFGGWFGGLSAQSSAAPFERPEALGSGATAAERAAYREEVSSYQERLKTWNEDTPRATRNSALGALTALLLGLVGSVLGGWMACGEPMNPAYRRTTSRATSPRL